MASFNLIIAGAGIAGTSLAAELLAKDYPGSILLFGDEPGEPYKRTQLSKRLAQGLGPADFPLPIMPREVPGRFQFLDRCRLLSLDHEGKIIQTSRGTFNYGKLVLALGASPVPIPEEFQPACQFYTRQDAIRLQKTLAGSSGQIEILGGGILGSEIADQVLRLGKEAHIVHRHHYPMFRELPESLGMKLKALMLEQGVGFVGLDRWDRSRKDRIRLWAAGTRPNILPGMALGGEGGILVDGFFRSSLHEVYAIGDCAQFPDESPSHLWHASEAQGIALAAQLCTQAGAYQPEIYRAKAEIFGQMIFSMGEIHTARGKTEEWEDSGISFWARAEEGIVRSCAFMGPADKAFARKVQDLVRGAYVFPEFLSILLSKS